MALNLDFSAKFPANSQAKTDVNKVGIDFTQRYIVGMPITKDINETITSITFDIDLSFRKLYDSYPYSPRNSWYIGLLDTKYESTASLGVGEDVIAAFENTHELVGFDMAAEAIYSVTLDNIYWTGEQTTKYVYIFNNRPYFASGTNDYNYNCSMMYLDNVSISSYSTAESDPFKLRVGLIGLAGVVNGAESSSLAYKNNNQYIGRTGTTRYSNVIKFYMPDFPRVLEKLQFDFKLSSVNGYTPPFTFGWAIATSDVNQKNYYTAGAVTDEYQIASGTISVPGEGIHTYEFNAPITSAGLYYLYLWTYDTVNKFGTMAGLNFHKMTAIAQDGFNVDYDANGHGTAPESQLKEPGVDLTLQPFISNQIATGYTVSFNANGGNSTPSNLTSTITYTQTSWNTNASGTGSSYDSEATYSADNNLTLYAIWQSSNGSITLPSSISRNNEAETAFSVILYNEGNQEVLESQRTAIYDFIGWAEGSTAGTKYGANESYTPNANVSMYATWSQEIIADPVDLPVLTKEGYSFLGWSEDSSATSGITGEYIPTKDVILYAIWSNNEYTLTVNPVGGTFNGSANQTVLGALSYNSSTWSYLTPAIREHYTFMGWYDADGEQVYDSNGNALDGIYWNNSLYIYPGNLTVYAYWEIITYEINYYNNGYGTAPEAQIKESGVDITLRNYISNQNLTGYTVTFDGNGAEISQSPITSTITLKQNSWNTMSNGGGTQYYANEIYSDNDDLDVYAIWLRVYNSINLPEVSRDKYRFAGWSTDPQASSGITGKYTPSSNITLYAIWKPLKISFVKVNGVWKTR